MTIEISQRTIVNSDKLVELVVEVSNDCVEISVGSFVVESSGNIRISSDSLCDLIEVLQQFDIEKDGKNGGN
tara:strand:- start:273 stop:488 length:216 start_codon:yes stop_codon:yes gene_type:complete